MADGIDTSVLVRLITKQPSEDFEYCIRQLAALAEQGVEVYASNQVIGEAYVTAMHHYDFSDLSARTALVDALRSGLVSPLNGQAVFDALEATSNPGLFDRLITDGYTQAGLETLTLDRRMARLPNARLL